MSKEPTVRDIAWHVNFWFASGKVFAEDQYLFDAWQYADQVVREHNTVQALRRELKEVQAVVEAVRAEFPQLVRLLEEKLHEEDR